MAVPSRPTVQVRDNIELNETEKKIFDRLLGTVRHFGLQNQLRVAGGWVRDKVRTDLSDVWMERKWVPGKHLFFFKIFNLALKMVGFGFAASGKGLL